MYRENKYLVTTTEKSSMFHVLRRYVSGSNRKPMPITFIANSPTKIAVK